MPRYLDPRNDYVFMRVFGKNKDLCISLLNSLLPIEAPIKSIEYVKTEMFLEYSRWFDCSIVDAHCTDENGRFFVVKIQTQWNDIFKYMVEFGNSEISLVGTDGFEKTKLRNTSMPIYLLNLSLYGSFDKTNDEFYHHYQTVNIAIRGTTTEETMKDWQFVFVELPKFKPENVPANPSMSLWLRYLREMGEDDKVPPEFLKEANIAKAVHLLETSLYTDAEIDAYERVFDSIRTDITLAEGKKRKGYAEGYDEGYAEGFAGNRAKCRAKERTYSRSARSFFSEGHAEGYAKGLEEGEAKRQTLDKTIEEKDRRIAELEKLLQRARK